MTADRAPRHWVAPEGLHLDVRGLQPPQPLVAILRLLRAQGADSTGVFVHLDRDPVMLYPELAELGWSAERIEGDPGEVRLRLVRG